MIEINLIPDVKLELLKARRQQRNIISLAILVSMAAGALVVLLAFYVFVVQTVALGLANNAVKSEYAELSKVQDLSKTLTIQNQMTQISTLHSNKLVGTRVFELLDTIVPTGTNKISVTSFTLDTDEGLITIEGEAKNGFEALDVFKKTIAKTNFTYVDGGGSQTVAILDGTITDGEQRYGESADGSKVLRFSLSFNYPAELFSPTSENGKVIAPNKQNATDSAAGVPNSLFTNGDGGDQ